MRNLAIFLFLFFSTAQAFEVSVSELSQNKIHKYYLDGGISIAVFKKSDEEKNDYRISILGKYLPITEFSRVFGNDLASSLYNQYVIESRNPDNPSKDFGVFLTYLPTTNCYFTAEPSSKNARLKDDCSGIEYDGNGKSLDPKVVSYLATPTFTVQNDKLVVDISSTTIPKFDFTPPRLIDRNFVRGMHRISNAFSWHRFDVVLDEIDIVPNVIETPEFRSLVAHIMLNTGATEQLKIISKITGNGFDLNKPIQQFNNEWYSATELGIASLHPLTLKFLATQSLNLKPCLTIERMVLIKKLSKTSNKFFDEKEFEAKLTPYMKLQGTEYCWERSTLRTSAGQ